VAEAVAYLVRHGLHDDELVERLERDVDAPRLFDHPPNDTPLTCLVADRSRPALGRGLPRPSTTAHVRATQAAPLLHCPSALGLASFASGAPGAPESRSLRTAMFIADG